MYPALTSVAVLAGFVDAVAGGGGLITVPALIYAGLPPAMVLGTNKLQSCSGTALATWRYHRAGLFKLRCLRCSLCWWVRRWAHGRFSGSVGVLKLLVPILLIAMAAYTLLSPRCMTGWAKVSEKAYLPIVSGIGFDGFFGPGTAILCHHAGFPARLWACRGRRACQIVQPDQQFGVAGCLAIGGQIMFALGLCMAVGAMTALGWGHIWRQRWGPKSSAPCWSWSASA
jgi:uncharacterized membrane protein YfcA